MAFFTVLPTADADLLFLPKSPAKRDVLVIDLSAFDAGTLSSRLVVLPELAECIPLSNDAPLPLRGVPKGDETTLTCAVQHYN